MDLTAGQNMVAGTVTLSAPDVNNNVTLTVNLTGGAIFYYDVNDPLLDDNLKIQDYAKAPKTNSSPGLFSWKTHVPTGSTTATMVLPANNFYGVRADIAVPCQWKFTF